jgi:hypothetical protein
MPGEINMEGDERVPRWVLHAIESKIAASEFRFRQQVRDPASTTAYFLKQTAKDLAWARELVRAHGKVKTEFWFDLPPYAGRKPKNLKAKLGLVDDDRGAQAASPNGGPAERFGNSGVGGGPPSVS